MTKMSFLRPEIEKRRLIELVRANPILWDCRLPHYKRSDKKKAFKWNELGRIFSVSGERLQRTFTSLREIFRREFNNEKLLGNSFASKWEYYDAMAFLKGVIRERKSRERLKSFPNQQNGGGSNENEQNIIDEYQYFAPNDPNNPNNCNQTILLQHQQQQSSILQNQLENTITTTIMPILIKHNKTQRQQLNNDNEQNIIDEYQYFSSTDPNNPNNFNQTSLQKQQQQEQHSNEQNNKQLSTILQSSLEKPTAATTTTTSTSLSTMPINQIQQKSQLQSQHHETKLQQNTVLTHTTHHHNSNNIINNNIQLENHPNGQQTLSNVSVQQAPTSQPRQQLELMSTNININNQLSNHENTALQQITTASTTRTSSAERLINITPNDINTLRSSSSSPSIYIKSEIDSQDEESIDDIDGLTEPSLAGEINNNNINNNDNNNCIYNLPNMPNLKLQKQQQQQQQQQKHQKNNNNSNNYNGIIASLENDRNQSQRLLEQTANMSSLYGQRLDPITNNNVQSQKYSINNNSNVHLNLKPLGPTNGNNFVTDMHIDLDMDEDLEVDGDLEDNNNGGRYSMNSNLTMGPTMSFQQAPNGREVLFARFADFLAARLNTLSEQVAHDLMNNILMLIAEQ